MIATKIISADEARGLLEGTTPGPLSVRGAYQSPRLESNGQTVASLTGRDALCNARLFAAAPDLRDTVIALHEGNARLRDAADFGEGVYMEIAHAVGFTHEPPNNHSEVVAAVATACRERDEARAEVERLRGEIELLVAAVQDAARAALVALAGGGR